MITNLLYTLNKCIVSFIQCYLFSTNGAVLFYVSSRPLDWPLPLLNMLHGSHGAASFTTPATFEGWGVKLGFQISHQDLEVQQVDTPWETSSLCSTGSCSAEGCSNREVPSRVSSSTLMEDTFTGSPGSEKQFVFKGPCVPHNPLPTRCLQRSKISLAFLISSLCCNTPFCFASL